MVKQKIKVLGEPELVPKNAVKSAENVAAELYEATKTFGAVTGNDSIVILYDNGKPMAMRRYLHHVDVVPSKTNNENYGEYW